MTNTIQAAISFISNPPHDLRDQVVGEITNRANSAGENLEQYIYDLYSGVASSDTAEARILKHQRAFSYIGNQNNPPDSMLRGGDAIEVKKFNIPSSGNLNGEIQLNSSHPKDYLFRSNPRLTQACRDSEVWDKKEMVYALGYVSGSNLRRLWLIYGDCYFADENTYLRVESAITESVKELDLELGVTKELGRVNKVDPLGITNLRVRGMWITSKPEGVFNYLPVKDLPYSSELIVLMSKKKYDSFSDSDRQGLENLRSDYTTIKPIDVRDPNNPAQTIDAVFINYRGN